MFEYKKNNTGIKEKAEIELALLKSNETQTIASDALCELAELCAGNMDAIVEIAGMLAEIQIQIAALAVKK